LIFEGAQLEVELRTYLPFRHQDCVHEIALQTQFVHRLNRGADRHPSTNERTFMNLTVRFSNPFYLSIFSAALLLTGWAIGARWGHSAVAGCALFWAIVALLIHDVAMTLVAGFSGYRAAMYVKNKEGK
jgi:hypothetical protein